MNIRSVFNSLFNNEKPKQTQTIKLLNDYQNYFTKFDSDIYNDATIRTCIHTIATAAAKLKPCHIRRVDGKVSKQKGMLDLLLSQRPNEFMSSYDFLYKVVSQLYLHNNSFVYIQHNGAGNIISLYPLDFTNLELRETTNNGELFCKFSFRDNNVTVPYTSLIHLRKNFATNEIFGSNVNDALQTPVSNLTILKQSLESAIKNSTRLRGYLQVTGTFTKKDQKAALDDFVSNIDSKSGYAVLDSKMEFKPLQTAITVADSTQLEFARQDLYRYFGLNEKIITASYNEAEFIAFYESIIEPLSIQMAQEFTAKLFSSMEKGFGNEIIFESNRLEYAPLKDKVSMINTLQQTGVLTINETRQIFGYEPIEGGEKVLVKADYLQNEPVNLEEQLEEDNSEKEGEKE